MPTSTPRAPERVVGLVLAAGASSRAGFPKALARLDGETFVARIARTLAEGGCDDVVIVVGEPHEAAIRAALPGARFASNPDPSRGMRSSIGVGLDAVGDADATLIALVDQPRVRADTVRALLAARGAPLVRPRVDGRRGHPFLVRRELFARLRDAPPELNARDVLGDAPAVDVDVDDAGVMDRLDTGQAIHAIGAERPAG